MSHKQFKEWFWKAMDEFITMAYCLTERNPLWDDATWQALRTVLSEEECEKKFLENIDSLPTHYCPRCAHEVVADPKETIVCSECNNRMSPIQFRNAEHR